MKVFLYLAMVLFPCAHAAVEIASPAVEHEAALLLAQFCADEKSEGGIRDNLAVFCEFAEAGNDLEETVQHPVVDLDTTRPSGQVQQQVVFIRPPTITYKHDVPVSGAVNPPQKTTIYVLPPKHKHDIVNVHQDNDASTPVPEKPSIYYLNEQAGKDANRPQPRPATTFNRQPAPQRAHPYLG